MADSVSDRVPFYNRVLSEFAGHFMADSTSELVGHYTILVYPVIKCKGVFSKFYKITINLLRILYNESSDIKFPDVLYIPSFTLPIIILVHL